MSQQLLDSQSLPVPVVFGSGANAYGVVRSLALTGAGPVAAYPGQGPMHLSRILAGRWRMPQPRQAERGLQILKARLEELNRGAFLIPTDEPWVNFVNQNRDRLGSGVYFPLSDPAAVNLMLSKSSMQAWCREHDLAQPRTRVFRPGQDWADLIAWARERLPVIIKPDTKGLGDEGLGFATAVFRTPDGLLRWATSRHPGGAPCTVLAQEYIWGPGCKLTAWHGYRSQDGRVYMIGITKLRSRPPRMGGCTAAARVQSDPVSQELALSMLDKLDFRGFFDLEFLIRPDGASPLYIELNQRPGMPNYISTALGLNLPLLALQDCRGRLASPPNILTNRPGTWLDLTSDPVLALTGKTSDGRRITPLAWLRSLQSRPVVDAFFNPRDPLVFGWAFVRLAGLGLIYLVRSKPGEAGPGDSKRPEPGISGRDRLWARVKYFAELARALGWGHMVKVALLNRFWRKLTFYQHDLDVTPSLAPSPGPELTWRILGPGEESLAMAVNPALLQSQVAERMALGHEGWVFFLAGRPVHLKWVVKGSCYLDYLGVRFELSEDELMHEATFTHRDFRRRGIANMARCLMIDQAQKQGFRRMITAAAWWNKAVEANYSKGLERLGTAVCMGCGPLGKMKTSGRIGRGPNGSLVLLPARD